MYECMYVYVCDMVLHTRARARPEDVYAHRLDLGDFELEQHLKFA